MTEKPPGAAPRIRVLISGHLPPPVGGMATYYHLLVNSRLSEHVDYRFAQTSSHKRQLASSGRATISNLVSALCDCLRYTRAFLAYRPQIAHIGTAFGLSFMKHSYCVLLARLWGKRVLLHPHCSLAALYHDRGRAWQWFVRRVIGWTDGVVVLSQEWMQLAAIVPGVKIYGLPNPVDIAEYQPAMLRHPSETRREGPLSVLYLGYLGRAKGSFDILEAAWQVRQRGADMVFHLVGGELAPGELERLGEKIRTLHLEQQVHLHPPAYGADKLKFFSEADLFIYPSYHEGVPMAVLEAMASGLAVVATRVGGLPDVVKHEVNGLLIEAGKPDQLADALCRLAQDDSLRISMQKSSYQMVCDRYGMDEHIAQLVTIYQMVMADEKTKLREGGPTG